MNPLGGVVLLLGVVVIIIGLRGLQHDVVKALSSARPTQIGGATTPTRMPAWTGTGARPVYA